MGSGHGNEVLEAAAVIWKDSSIPTSSLLSRSPLFPLLLILFWYLPHRYCDMNPDVTYASCDAPQEKTDKEVELDEDGNEVSESDGFFRSTSNVVSCFRRSLL